MPRLLNTHTLFLLAILGLAVFFRFSSITSTPPGLYPDEAMNGNNALEALKTRDFKVFYPENNGREGFFINIQALFLKTTGIREPWVLRLPSALFGVLTVLGVYFLSRELFASSAIGLFSSFFLAISFWHINFSRIGFRAITAPFFLVWGLFFLLRSMKNIKNKKSDKRSQFPLAISLAMLGGVIYGLGFHSYIAYRATPFLVLFIFLIGAREHGWKPIRLPIALFILAALATVLPLGLYLLTHPEDFLGRTSQISIFSSPHPLRDLGVNILKTVGMFNMSGDQNWRHNIPGNPQLSFVPGLLFLFGIFFTLKKLKTIKSLPLKREALPLVWLFVSALPVIISNEGIPHALRAILMVPAACILAGLGGTMLYELAKKKLSKKMWWLHTLVCLIAFFLVLETYHNYFVLWGKSRETVGAFNQNYLDIGKTLNSMPHEIPKYVVIDARGGLVREIPMPSQTVMFITDTFLPEKQKEKNIHYILSSQKGETPKGSFVVTLN